MTCPTCNNELKKRSVLSHHIGPKCTPIYEKVSYCPYCEWKGTAGPGAYMRAMIKESQNAKL